MIGKGGVQGAAAKWRHPQQSAPVLVTRGREQQGSLQGVYGFNGVRLHSYG